MDTMKILLGATVALLFAALVLSWQRMWEDNANVPPDELARVEAQITQLEIEQQRLDAERELRTLRGTASPIPGTQGSTPITMTESTGRASDLVGTPEPNRMTDLEQRLADAEAKLADSESEKARLERDKDVARDEAGLIAQRDLETHDRELRRARLISQALLIATVEEYVENPDVGSFAVISISRPENVEPAIVLSLRRNTGILGKLQVGEITGDEAIATPIPGSFQGGTIDIQPGDELIIAPPF